MATKKPATASEAAINAARKRAEQTRQQLQHKPSPSDLLTPQELADAAPFYFVLRNYICQLKKAREQAGVTLAELSGRTGLAVETLSRLETGALTNPTWKTLGVCAAALGLRPRLLAEPAEREREVDRPTGAGDRLAAMDRLVQPEGGLTSIWWDRPSLDQVRIGEYVFLDPPQGFGFPQFRVFEVLLSPTSTDDLRVEDFRALIFARTTASYADIVCIEDVDGGKHKVVAFAFRAFPDLADTPLQELTALDIVEKMAQRFGVLMHIGYHEGKFFLKAQFEKPSVLVPGRDESAAIHFDVPAGGKAIAGTAFRIDGDTVKVALAFGLDPVAYQEWVGRH